MTILLSKPPTPDQPIDRMRDRGRVYVTRMCAGAAMTAAFWIYPCPYPSLAPYPAWATNNNAGRIADLRGIYWAHEAENIVRTWKEQLAER